MNHHLSMVREQMATEAQACGLPEFYKDDLKIDFDALPRFDGLGLVWLLRTNGSVLAPINIGVNPVYITYWLEENHGQRIKCFYIDTSIDADIAVRRITEEKAARLLNQPAECIRPMEDARVSDINDVLRRGLNFGIWGRKTPNTADSIGNWNDWRRFFRSSDNRVMSSFMQDAIRTVNRRTAV